MFRCLFLICSGTLCALLAGCAADGAAPDEGAAADALSSSTVTPGIFKLYRTPRAEPNPSCDIHTRLTLTAEGGSHASLREVVGGVCEIFVDPAPRDYRLRLDGTDCGSKIYKGRGRFDGKLREITITDHRARVCEDIVEAAVIVEETPATEGEIQRLFSATAS